MKDKGLYQDTEQGNADIKESVPKAFMEDTREIQVDFSGKDEF